MYLGVAKPYWDSEKQAKLLAENPPETEEETIVTTAPLTQPLAISTTTAAPETTVADETTIVEVTTIAEITIPAETTAPLTTTIAKTTNAPAKTTAAKTTAPPVVTLNAKPQTEVVKEEENAETDANGKPTRQGTKDENVILNGNEYRWNDSLKIWVGDNKDAKTTYANFKSDGYINPLTDTGAIDLTKVVTPKGKIISYERYLEIVAGGYQTDS